MSIRNLMLVSVIAFFVSACGGGDSSVDNSSNQAGAPEIAGNYIFRGQGNASGTTFNGTFTATTFSLEAPANANGSVTITGANLRGFQLRESNGEVTNGTLEVNGNNQVTRITFVASTGATFSGTRR